MPGFPLVDRRRRLRSLIPKQQSNLLYCDHVEEHGQELFTLACEHDLEGIVAKRKSSALFGRRWHDDLDQNPKRELLTDRRAR